MLKLTVGRADGDSVHEHIGGHGDVMQLAVGRGDSDSVCEHRRGDGDSVGVKEQNETANSKQWVWIVLCPASHQWFQECAGDSAGACSFSHPHQRYCK